MMTPEHRSSNSHLSPAPVANLAQSKLQSVFRSFAKSATSTESPDRRTAGPRGTQTLHEKSGLIGGSIPLCWNITQILHKLDFEA